MDARDNDWNAPCVPGGPAMTADVVVIGGGAAGLTASQVAAAAGRRVILVERDRLGGECLFTGCIPSKTLLAVAKRVRNARAASSLGLTVLGAPAWPEVRAELRRSIQSFRERDGLQALQAGGVRVVRGAARFTAPRVLTVRCGEHTHDIHARAFVLATGSVPNTPPIAGLEDVPFLTHETLFDLPQQPTHLLVVGGGAVGCEVTQAFTRLGSDVTLVHGEARLLPTDEPEASEALLSVLRAEGATVHLDSTVERVERSGGGVVAFLSTGEAVHASHLFLATGKRPNVEGLGLEVIGAAFDEHGLKVDARMRSTTVPYVWGAGDVVGGLMFTHGATERGTLAALGALGPLGRLVARWWTRHARVERIPWVTFTTPEIAHWGLAEAEAVRRHGRRVEVVEYDYRHLDRAVTDREAGFVKLVALRGLFGSPVGMRVVGVQVVGGPAGELAQLLSLSARLGFHPLRLALTPAPYPTYAEAARQASLGLMVRGRAFGVRRPGRAAP